MTALPSTLDAVTVYREGAICRRLVKVPPSTGRTVLLGGLPLSLEPGTLRARVVSGRGKVLDVRAQFDVQLAEEVDVPAERRAVEESSAKVKALEARLQRVEAELAELTALRPSFLEPKRGEPPRPAHVDAMLALGDFREGELAARLGARRELNEALAEARRELQLHEQRVREASTAQRAERARVWRVALVTLAEAPAEPLELSLEYRVPGARWVPSYALTLEKGLSGGALQMRASIVQQTGEDWSGVALSLSTTSASRSAEMPELKALKLGRHQEPPPRSGWRPPPPGLDSLFEAYDAAFAAPAPASAGEPPPRAEPVLPPPPPPPRPAPAPAGAPMMAMAEKSAPRRSMAPPPMMAPAAPKGGFGGMARSRGGAAPPSEPELDEMMEDMPPEEEAMAAASFDDEGGTGEYEIGAPAPEPETTLGRSFGDYSRLSMPSPSAGRGRLVEAPTWSGVFVGVSVQVDVVMALVSTAQRLAGNAQYVSLPSLTNPVSSVKSFDYRYDCQARVDVPSTGKWVLVPVMTCPVGLTPEYVCVPSVEQKVYRTLTVANRSQHALLPGPVDVTAGDEFLMTTTLPAITPGAEQSHRLGLGVEESIKVSRKTQYKETTGGFLGGSTVLPHEVEIELNNRLPVPALIEVRERVPYANPDEKDLKVEETQVAPPWERVEGPVDDVIVRGARRWQVTVPPGQVQKLSAAFAIRMPSDKMIVGGNRRS